jgi:predicted transcriptional regulator
MGDVFLGNYRDRLEIIADILAVAEGGAKKTRIMYIANLSYNLLKKYLHETLQIGFLRQRDDIYELTERGKTFLNKYKDFSRKHSKIKQELQTVLSEREVLEQMCEPEQAFQTGQHRPGKEPT